MPLEFLFINTLIFFYAIISYSFYQIMLVSDYLKQKYHYSTIPFFLVSLFLLMPVFQKKSVIASLVKLFKKSKATSASNARDVVAFISYCYKNIQSCVFLRFFIYKNIAKNKGLFDRLVSIYFFSKTYCDNIKVPMS